MFRLKLRPLVLRSCEPHTRSPARFLRNEFYAGLFESPLNFPDSLYRSPYFGSRSLQSPDSSYANRSSFCELKLTPPQKSPSCTNLARKNHL
jgi:hypothetical protein